MQRKLYLRGLLLLSLLLCQCESYSQEPDHTGKVVGISDGDTFTLLTPDKKQLKVRLSEIDSPESNQPYGTRAKQALSDLIFSKQVKVVKEEMDRYGRMVGHVYVDGLYVNRRMVQEGYAWVYRQYNKDKSLLQDEQGAREAKRGLWSLPITELVPPWEWRRGVKTNDQAKEEDQTNPAQKFTCGTKRYCREMISCEYLNYGKVVSNQ